MDAAVEPPKRALNIAFVLQRFCRVGGTEGHVWGLASWLDARGHRVEVFCAEGDRAPGGVQLRPIRGVIRGVALSLAIAARLQTGGDHDIVQGFGRTVGQPIFRAGGGVHEAYLRARNGSLLAGFAGAVSVRDRVELALDRRAICHAKRVICNSEMVAAQMHTYYGIGAPTVRVVRNGVDCSRFRPSARLREDLRREWRLSSQGLVAMFLGSGFRRKGLLVAAEAFLRVAKSADRFVVVGSDAHARRWRGKLVKRLGAKLIWVGPVSDPERFLPAADATLLPTIYDAAANTTLEALACGTPPITSGRDGNSEVVPVSDLVVRDPTDADGFAHALAFAWNNPELGDVCRSEALCWPISRNAETMERTYLEFVDARE